MAIGLIFEGNGVTQEQYEQVLAQAVRETSPRRACSTTRLELGKTASSSSTSGESPASMHAFETEKLKQARQAAHIISHEVTIFPLINIMSPVHGEPRALIAFIARDWSSFLALREL